MSPIDNIVNELLTKIDPYPHQKTQLFPKNDKRSLNSFIINPATFICCYNEYLQFSNDLSSNLKV